MPRTASDAIADVRNPTAMARNVPTAMIASAMRSSRFWAVTVAAAVAKIGVISSATSMAPMTTPAESASRPKAAIDDDRTMSAANRRMNSIRASPVGNSSWTAARASGSGSRPSPSRSNGAGVPHD